MFLEGQVTPAFAGVEITITEGTGGDPAKPPIKVLTDDKGKYRYEYSCYAVRIDHFRIWRL